MRTGIVSGALARMGVVLALALSTSFFAAAATAGAISVSFSGASSLFGISKPGLAITGGGLDQNGNSYAGDQLGTSLVYAGDTYRFAGPGPTSAASSKTINLPSGNFGRLTLLGGAVDGAQTNQAFVVTYTDATTTTFTQSLSDWGMAPQNYPNEVVVKTLTYKITSTGGTHAGTYHVYAYTFALNSTKTVKSVKLPTNRKVVMIGADLLPPATVTTSSVSLTGFANLFGISKPGLAITGTGLDTGNASYAGDVLGTSLVFGGATYHFAPPGPNSAATSTTIPLPTGSFTKLTVLGTAVAGAQTNQPFVVTYTDGTTTTFTQSLSDWGSAPQNYPNETVVKTLPYKILPDGTTHANTYKVYAYTFALNGAKTAKSLKLPANRRVVIIAADVVGTALPTAASPTFSPLPGTFTTAPTVTLADATAGASLFFTTNGTPPTTSSTKYTVPFKVAATGTTTVEVMAVASGFSNSPVTIAAYTVSGTTTPTATPTFSPAPGTYGAAQNVTLSDATAGASIFFTTDGSTPTTASTKFTTAIAVSSTRTIKAIATASGHTTSAVAGGTYTISGTGGAPTGLSYTPPPPLLIGKAVSLSPTVTGTVTKYVVVPTLPKGLAINATTGVISGTPTTVTASAPYTVTASNAAGAATFKLTLQVDSGPRVHLTATATTSNGAPLTFTWKVTDGALTGTNGAQADWELPPGFGLHFAYVLVADGRGGYAEGRVVVNTDSFGAPQVITIKSLPPTISSPYQMPHAHLARTAATVSRGVTVRPDSAPGNMLMTGNVLLGDKTLPGVNDPFFGVRVDTTVSETSQDCISNFGCPGAVTAGEFGDFSINNDDPGPAGNPQTLKAIVQGATGTRNFTFAQGDLDAGVAKLPTLLIAGTGTPTISAMSATFNSTQVGAFQLILPDASGTPSDGYPQQNWFLSYLGHDDAPSACQYYLAVGAVTSCDSNGRASGAVTFTGWQKQVGIDNFATDGKPTALATYVNVVDLNLTRSHHSIRHDDGDMGAYVCNHLGPVDGSGKALSVNLPSNTMTAAQQTAVNTAVANANAGKNLVACVAMDYISTPINGFMQFTRFLVFGPSGELLPSVNLDGRGEKFVPGACVACHGGDSYSGKFGQSGNAPDIGSHFLPYDAGNFAFSTATGFTEAAQEPKIYQLNQNILNTNPTPSVTNLITNWYKAGQVLDKNFVPAAWQGFPDVYQQVVARSCRTCHAALSGFDWDALGPDNFAQFAGDVCDTGTTAGTQVMPNSKVTFDRLWNSRGTSEDQVAKLTAFYHTQGTLPSGSSCVLRAPPH